jgi:hypothetical protein
LATTATELLRERVDGTVTREPLPEPGTLVSGANFPWFFAKSGALYQRRGDAWTKVTLPAGYWTPATHAPYKLEALEEFDGETLVHVARTENGFGNPKPKTVRTVFSTQKRATPLRCGYPFDGDDLGELPAKMEPTCTTPMVFVGREKAPNASATKLTTALKGKVAGDAALVAFGTEKRPFAAVQVATFEDANGVVTALASANIAAEALCGAPTLLRTTKLTLR